MVVQYGGTITRKRIQETIVRSVVRFVSPDLAQADLATIVTNEDSHVGGVPNEPTPSFAQSFISQEADILRFVLSSHFGFRDGAPRYGIAVEEDWQHLRCRLSTWFPFSVKSMDAPTTSPNKKVGCPF